VKDGRRKDRWEGGKGMKGEREPIYLLL